jgi:hypothetical protein
MDESNEEVQMEEEEEQDRRMKGTKAKDRIGGTRRWKERENSPRQQERY